MRKSVLQGLRCSPKDYYARDQLKIDNQIESTRRWVETVVVDLNLCPFARRELVKNRVRFTLSAARSEEQLLVALESELSLLEADTTVETTLLIHPDVLADFLDYNQFLDLADGLLLQMNLDGIYQVASFHPDYQFAGTEADDVENYTNRSPYPMLHLLREDSIEEAIASHQDVAGIPAKNKKLMFATGIEEMQKRLAAC